ncbi:unnamed protein product [Rotaria socialis]|uniref:HAT C-terminal dimerisation domain-containing protein n=2 Tax=Rotaria socialis TaxID=392032 RepID=A0A817RQT2_9BILA|nr:unnamed protein product [Rotaria socialis]
MSKTTNDQSSLAEQDDDSNTSSSSVVIDASDILPSYNHEKIANSVVEQFFYELKTHDDGTKSAKCLLCRSIVKQSTTSTYNYGRHVYRKHMKETNKWKLALDSKKSNKSTKQSTVQQSFGQRSRLSLDNITEEHLLIVLVNQKYGAHNPRQLELHKMIVQDLIIELGLPLSIVDHPAFLRAMNTIDPKFTVLSRRTLCREAIPSALEQVMIKVKQACSDAKFVALTLDTWSDRRMRTFIAITMHTIANNDDSFQDYLLTFQPLSGSHTGDNLRRQLEDAMANFNIENKVARIVTDNASNNLKAFDELVIPGFEVYFEPEDDEDEHDDETENDEREEKDEQNNMNDQEERLRIPCFSHTLQLTVGDGLKECGNAKPALAKVATIAKLSHKSTLFAEHLQRENISIPLPVKTRWNSQHHTICKVLEISLTLLNDLLRNVGRADLVLTARDIIILQEFASIFALFAEATTRTQIENSASISLVAPSVLSIYYDLEHEQANCKYLGSLCRTLIISLHERFGGLLERCEVFADSNMKIKKRSTSDLYKDDIYLIAPFLDGRFKLKWVVASNLSESTKERTTNIIKALLFKAALQLHGTTNNTSDCIIESSITECSTTDDDGMSNLPNFKRKRLFSGYEGQKTPMQKKRSCVSESIENEISMFEKELLDDTRLIFLKKDSYPYLHRLATRVLCVPATSAPVERVFSSSGILMRPHRSRLSKNMLSILTLLKCNRKLL